MTNNTNNATDAKNHGNMTDPMDAVHLALGEIVLLMANSDSHRKMPLQEIPWFLLPPVAARQYRLMKNAEGETMAYVSWARVNEEVEARLLAGEMQLNPSDWNSGEKAVLMDIIASPQDMPRAVGAVKKEVFPDEPLMVIRRKKEGGVEMHPVELTPAGGGEGGGSA